MTEIRTWPASVGLQDANAFEGNDIDMDLLRQVDGQKAIGASIAGHGLRIRDAIVKVSASSPAIADHPLKCIQLQRGA